MAQYYFILPSGTQFSLDAPTREEAAKMALESNNLPFGTLAGLASGMGITVKPTWDRRDIIIAMERNNKDYASTLLPYTLDQAEFTQQTGQQVETFNTPNYEGPSIYTTPFQDAEPATDQGLSPSIQSTVLTTPDGVEHRVELGSEAYYKYLNQGASEVEGTARNVPDTYTSGSYAGGTQTGGLGTAQTGGLGTAQPGSNLQPTGDPGLDVALQNVADLLTQLEARGKVLNPNITLDAKTLAKFLQQAESEINPYYATQLKAARESLASSTGFSLDELGRREAEDERQYGKAVRTLGESSADVGFAQSGLRQRDERELAEGTQRSLDERRRNLSFDASNTARQFAQAYGSSQLPNFQIGNAPTVNAGEGAFGKTTGQRDLYTLDPNVYSGLVGSQEFERRGNVLSRSAQLESAFRDQQGLTQQRQLVF